MSTPKIIYNCRHVICGGKKIVACLGAISLTFLCLTVNADFTGKCIDVADDGDSIKIERDGKIVEVKLSGVSCPVSGQEFSREALQFTKELAFGKDVEIREKGIGKGGIVVGFAVINGKDLGEALLKAGLAWNYPKGNAGLAVQEKAARDAGLRIWSNPASVPPWEFNAKKDSSAPGKMEQAGNIIKQQPDNPKRPVVKRPTLPTNRIEGVNLKSVEYVDNNMESKADVTNKAIPFLRRNGSVSLDDLKLDKVKDGREWRLLAKFKESHAQSASYNEFSGDDGVLRLTTRIVQMNIKLSKLQEELADIHTHSNPKVKWKIPSPDQLAGIVLCNVKYGDEDGEREKMQDITKEAVPFLRKNGEVSFSDLKLEDKKDGRTQCLVCSFRIPNSPFPSYAMCAGTRWGGH